MKRDYSTFVLLPQKTSTHISIPANILKNIAHIISVIKKNIKSYNSIVLIDQDLASNSIEHNYRVFCDYHTIFKHC